MQTAPVDNRLELMDRALDLFAAYGYDSVSVQQICEAAAVTKPTLYHYFGNKRGLLETLLRDRIAPLLQSLQELAGAPSDTIATLQRAASLMLAFARANPNFYRLFLALWFAPMRNEGREVAAAFHTLHFEAMEAVCAAALGGEAEMRARIRPLTATLHGLLNNAIGLALNNYTVLNDRVANVVVDQFLYGFRQRPAAARKRERKP